MPHCILYRNSYDYRVQEADEELQTAKKYFMVLNQRTQIPARSTVIGRYSVLPYYHELEVDLDYSGSRLINSYSEHRYIADLRNYYPDIQDYTPRTYTEWGNLGAGKWVVKGVTNSRKFNWNTHMYAEGRENLLQVIRNLLDDPFIAEQGLVVREYLPLKRLETLQNGLPVSREWRLFFYKETLLCSGFYWSCSEFDPPLPREAQEFAQKVARIITKKTNFFVMDIAELESGGFVVIELNDGQMSGLSNCQPEELYKNLKQIIKEI